EDRTLQLDVEETAGLGLSSVFVSHIHANDLNEAIWDTFDLADRSKVEIGAEATMIITYEYDGTIVQNQTSEETKYFADQYLQPIQANTAISVNIDGITKATIGEAMLRIGMGRDHGLSLTPKVTVNGTNVAVPDNWRGDDQRTRDEFFGVLEVPVPYPLIQEKNEVTITFSDNGGHVSSISMQHYNQTAAPNKPEVPDEPDVPLNVSDQVGEINIYPNPAKKRVTIEIHVKEAQVRLLDMSGRVQFEKKISSGKRTIDVSGMSGSYIIQVLGSDGVWISKLLVE
ncbi:MAG: T9SS type A sorting domain-containing protein, partial [Bacteroidota bacterium]